LFSFLVTTVQGFEAASKKYILGRDICTGTIVIQELRNILFDPEKKGKKLK
jgi:hypothetical protein